MLTVLGSDITSASPGQLALSAVLAVLFAAIGYRMSTRYRALRGVTPWRVPSFVWALLCLVLPFVGLALEVLAELTTRSPYTPAPARPGGGPERAPRYSPPSSTPVAVEPPSAGELPGVLLPRASRSSLDERADEDQSPTARWPVPGPDERGRPPLFGWYPDPAGRHERRYFDGRCWNDHCVDGDVVVVDPLR